MHVLYAHLPYGTIWNSIGGFPQQLFAITPVFKEKFCLWLAQVLEENLTSLSTFEAIFDPRRLLLTQLVPLHHK